MTTPAFSSIQNV